MRRQVFTARWAAFAGCLAIGWLLVGPSASAQQHHRPQHGGDDSGAGAALDAEARAIFQAGNVAYEDGRFADALGYFRRAYDLSHRPELLYNVGSAADKLRLDADAMAAFREYLVQLPAATNRREVEARLRVLERTSATTTGTTTTGTTTGTTTTGTTTTGTTTNTTTGTTTTGALTTGTTTGTTTGATSTGTTTGGDHADGHVTPEHDLSPHHVATQDLDHTPAPTQHTDDGGVAGQWWFWTLVGVVVAGAAVGIVLALTQHSSQSTDGLVSGTDGMVHYALTGSP